MPRLIFALITIALCSTAAAERNYKQFETELDATVLERLELDCHVGSVDIASADDNQVHINLKVYAKRRWFGLRESDLEDVDLEIEQSGESLSLQISENDFEEQWLIRLPPTVALTVDMGVGDIDVRDLRAGVSVDLGVGDARIVARREHYRSVNSEVGVGDAAIHVSDDDTQNHRVLVSAESSWRGDGEHRISVDVGVGSAVVELD